MDNLGYKCFEQLGSPRPLMFAKFNSKTRLQSKFLVFLSHFVCVGFQSLLKVLILSFFILFFLNAKRGVKNAEFDADFKSVEKVAKDF